MKRWELLRRVLVSDGRGDPKRILRIFREAFEAGLRSFQVREPAMADRDALALLQSLRTLLPRGKALLFVNDRVDLCLACGADGVQLGFRSFSIREARQLLGVGAWIGASIHNPKETLIAASQGADFAVFGPVFATPSKRGILPPAGVRRLADTVNLSPMPVLAIGGIDINNAAQVLATGCHGFACIRAVFEARDVRARSRALVEVPA